MEGHALQKVRIRKAGENGNPVALLGQISGHLHGVCFLAAPSAESLDADGNVEHH
jgi:hypothetical protein